MHVEKKTFGNGFVRARNVIEPGDEIYFGDLRVVAGDNGDLIIFVDKSRVFDADLAVIPSGNSSDICVRLIGKN